MGLEDTVDSQKVISITNILRTVDMNSVDTRLVNAGKDMNYVDGLREETIRFLGISGGVPGRFAPSKLVDEYWHELVLNTPLYRNISEKIGKFVDHIPSNRAEVESYNRTLETYPKVFGQPSPKYWKLNCAADCESFCTSGACEASCRD